MSAEPVPDPDLETTVRHVLPQKIDAVAYGLSVMHHDVREIRRTVDDHTLRLGDLAEGQRDQTERLGLHGGQLAALAEGQRKQGELLDQHGTQLTDLQGAVAEILRRLPDPDDPRAR